MLKPVPPMSNLERQRQFRERNPGYYGRLHARRRAETEARLEMKRLEAAQAKVARRQPLMLPAPVETIEIPGMNVIPALHELQALQALAAPAPLPVSPQLAPAAQRFAP
jgi:hypothetical protein